MHKNKEINVTKHLLIYRMINSLVGSFRCGISTELSSYHQNAKVVEILAQILTLLTKNPTATQCV